MIVRYSEQVYLIKNFLSKSACELFIEHAENQGFSEATITSGGEQVSAPEIRNNDRVIIDSSGIAADWFQKAERNLPQAMNNMKLYRLNERLRFYRYSKNQQFRLHKDFPYTDHNRASKLSFIVYLAVYEIIKYRRLKDLI